MFSDDSACALLSRLTRALLLAGKRRETSGSLHYTEHENGTPSTPSRAVERLHEVPTGASEEARDEVF